jgi:glutamate/tyrosine decarboxylase-like PLP-dependent enzyme
MSQELETKPKTLEEVRKNFVDPKNPQSAEDLAQLGSDAIKAMAQIYATGGEIEKMCPETKKWLQNPRNSDCNLQRVVGTVLQRESKTRRFDHRFMGQIHPQGNKVGIIANLVAAYMNTNRIFSGVSPAEGKMEEASLKWLSKMFGYASEKSGGNLTTGGTEANIEALWIAREKVLDGQHTDVFENTQPMYVFVSDQRHYSIDKACKMLGLQLITVKSRNFKVDLHDLDEKVWKVKMNNGLPVAIIGIAGETETGMVEDLQGIAKIAKEYGVFFHVDAAYGGPFILSRKGDLFAGIAEADSITVDPHKMLYTPYPAGAILFKNKEDHFFISKVHEARYLRDLTPRVVGSMSSAGAISTWATIKLFGAEGIKSMLNHTLDLADVAFNRVCQSKVLRPLYKPELNTLLMGLTMEFKEKLRAKGLTDEAVSDNIVGNRDKNIVGIEEEVYGRMKPGDSYIAINSKTDLDPITNYKFPAFRYIGMHPYTTTEDVEKAISDLEKTLETRMAALVEKH